MVGSFTDDVAADGRAARASCRVRASAVAERRAALVDSEAQEMLERIDVRERRVTVSRKVLLRVEGSRPSRHPNRPK
jgi:hypothetical protein